MKNTIQTAIITVTMAMPISVAPEQGELSRRTVLWRYILTASIYRGTISESQSSSICSCTQARNLKQINTFTVTN